MAKTPGLINHLRAHQPATWSLLKLAAVQGLISLDLEGDTLILDSEFGYNHPQLYESLRLLIEEWSVPAQMVAIYATADDGGSNAPQEP
jgi:hypothetical protein